jgi:hypothetical protein
MDAAQTAACSRSGTCFLYYGSGAPDAFPEWEQQNYLVSAKLHPREFVYEIRPLSGYFGAE